MPEWAPTPKKIARAPEDDNRVGQQDFDLSLADLAMGCSVVVRISVDSVYGGNANAYNYPDDPINGNDLSGKCFLGLCHIAHIIAKGYHYVKKHLRKAIASSVGQLLATVLGDAIVGIISGACGEGAYVCGIVGGAVVGGLTEGLHEWADGDNHVHWVNVIVAAITSV